MTKKTTELSQATPCCYCCLSETNLIEHSNKGLVYHLCDDCQDAGFKLIGGLYILVCSNHGEQKHLDIENHEFLQKRARAGHYYNYPVHTRRTKENGLKPVFGVCRYDVI